MKVKPLEWDDGYDNGTVTRATACGVGEWAVFEVVSVDPDRGRWTWDYGTDGDFYYYPDQTVYANMDAAKDAANRWHAARVSEWLEPDSQADA